VNDILAAFHRLPPQTQAVARLVAERPEWSLKQIAAHLGIAHHNVRRRCSDAARALKAKGGRVHLGAILTEHLTDMTTES
jgi:DNA-directed RNA polymerase specialized sigma24 family protein